MLRAYNTFFACVKLFLSAGGVFAFLTILLFGLSTQAAVVQSGSVTPGHAVCWTTTGVLQDCGTPASPSITGGLGVLSNNQLSIGASNAAPTSGNYTQGGIGVDSNGTLHLSVQKYGSAPASTAEVDIDGVAYPLPYPGVANSTPYLNASAYGVIPGTASVDAALKTAVAACAATPGTTLYLPAGVFNITGAAQTLLQNCNLVGATVPGGSNVASGAGTQFNLTSLTTAPFICGNNFSLKGIVFYWPGQNGATAYPPLITNYNGTGYNNCGHVLMDNIYVVNAWYFVQQQGVAGELGDWKITNSETFACDADFEVGSQGDGWTISNLRVIPGAWLSSGGSNAAVGQCASTQKVFHVIASSGAVNFNITNMVVVGARYGFYLESGSSVSETTVLGYFDSVGTIVDSSAGGTWSFGNTFSGGNSGCAIPATVWGQPNGGNVPCFYLGSSGTFELYAFTSGGSNGNFITTAGSNVTMIGNSNYTIGGITDGGDYYQILVTANAPTITVISNHFGGNSNTLNNQKLHAHGITAGANLGDTVINDNYFIHHNDEINLAGSNTAVTVAGNTSTFTAAASGAITLGGTSVGYVYGSNNWDVGPVGTINTGNANATITGTLSGKFYTGTGSSVTSFTFTMPFEPKNALNQGCVFQDANAVALGASVASAPPVWTVSAGSNVAGHFITFNCGGT